MNKTARDILMQLGLWVGLYEAVSIVYWDWIMDLWQVEHVATGIGWGIAIVALNVTYFHVLGRIMRGSLWGVTLTHLILVVGTRLASGDRFEKPVLALVPLGLLLAFDLQHSLRLDAIKFAKLRRYLTAPGIGVVCGIAAILGRQPTTAFPEPVRIAWHVGLSLFIASVAVAHTRFGHKVAATATALLVAVPLGYAATKPKTTVDQPNVLIVLIDTLRRDHVQPFGNEANTPRLLELAHSGKTYDQAVTVIPKTTPSVASIFTGRYPAEHGLRRLYDHLPASESTLADILRERGYHTAAFTHNGYVSRGRGLEQGFQYVESFFEVERPYGLLSLTGAVSALDWLTVRKNLKYDGITDAAHLTDSVLRHAKGIDGSYFMYVHYFDPHWPFTPPGEDADIPVNDPTGHGITRGTMIFNNPFPDDVNARARELYRKEVEYNDAQVGRLFDGLREMGLMENTLVIAIADHGTSLGEHNYHYHHGEFLYDQSIRIPLIASYPGVIPAGEREPGLVRTIDMLPTVLEWIGFGDATPDGISGQSVAKGSVTSTLMETDVSYFEENGRRYLSGTLGNLRGVRSEQDKWIYTPRPKQAIWERYDLTTDHDERTSMLKPEEFDAVKTTIRNMIPGDERKKLDKLGGQWELAEQPLPTSNAPIPKDQPEISDSEENMLRALGYIE